MPELFVCRISLNVSVVVVSIYSEDTVCTWANSSSEHVPGSAEPLRRLTVLLEADYICHLCYLCNLYCPSVSPALEYCLDIVPNRRKSARLTEIGEYILSAYKMPSLVLLCCGKLLDSVLT